MVMWCPYLIQAGFFILVLISFTLAVSSGTLVSDNFSGSGNTAGSDTQDTDSHVLHPAAVMSWSDVTMVSGKIRNFQKEFRYESGLTH